MTLLLVAGAAAAGAPARFLLDRAVAARAGGVFPWGTLVVNVAGSFLLGLLVGLADHHGLPRDVLTVAGTGFLGAFTTFSTLMYETVRLVEDAAYAEAAANVGTSVTLGLLAAAAGLGLTLLW